MELEQKDIKVYSRREEGRKLARKTVGDDKVTGIASIADNSITTSKIASLAVTQTKMASGSVGQNELKIETATVTISSGTSSGTAAVSSGSIVIGFYPSTNCDQIVKNISVSGTTLTVNLLANATSTTTIKIILLKT